MAVHVSCPGCRATYNLPDLLTGKKVTCKKCQMTFTVAGGVADEEPLDVLPVSRQAPRSSRREDALQDRPGRVLPARASYDEDDLPRPRKAGPVRAETKSSSLPLIIVGALAGLLLILGGGAAAIWFFWSSSPTATTPLAQGGTTATANYGPNPNLVDNVADVVQRPPEGGVARDIEDLKAATVYIQVEAGPLEGSGSGWVMRTDGETAYIVTNNHVINPKVQVTVASGPAFPFPGGPFGPRFGPGFGPRGPFGTREVTVAPPNSKTTVVFWSGTRNEQSVQADILGCDAEHDLAVIRVAAVRNLPKPIDFGQPLKLVETMPVTILGFPFGQALSTNKRHPAITVGKGSISSIRRDDNDDIAYVQLDAALNPGNSGGPVVNADGQLVGVAVAIIRDSRGIALAVPAQSLTRMLQGTIGTAHFTTRRVTDGTAEVEVQVPVIDPLNRIKPAAIHYVRTDHLRVNHAPNADGAWPELPGSQRVELLPGRLQATAVFKVTAPEKANVPFSYQASYVGGDGKTWYTPPGSFQVNFGAPIIVNRPGPVANPVPPKELTEAEVTQVLEEMQSPDGFKCRAAIARLFPGPPRVRREEVARALEGLLSNKDGFTRKDAAHALGVWGDKKNVPGLLGVIDDESLFVRAEAIQALGKIKDPRAAEPLTKRLVDTWDRGHASQALKAMGTAAEKAVIALLKHDVGDVRVEGCRILETIGTRESIPPLQNAVLDKNQQVSLAAANALRAINTRK